LPWWVELLVTALTGARMGFEVSPFFVDEGDKPRIGQAFPCFRSCRRTKMCAYRAIAATILPTGTAQEGLKVSEVTMQKLEKSSPKAEFCRPGGGTVTSGPHLGNNASLQAPFGGECKNLRVEFARLRNSVRREAPL
jgi:hypothetical protein